MLGQEVIVSQVNETYKATALDIDETGHLIIQKESGEVLCMSSGEISIRPLP